jgi:hypothetical protein
MPEQTQNEPTPDTPAPATVETEPTLGPAGERALAAERDARKKAEAEAREAKRRADELEREQMSEQERLKAEAEEGRRLKAEAEETLRQANLLTALGGHGLVGPKAKAAVRLLEGVEFDDGQQPTNLDAAMDAAKATYGTDLFTVGATPTPTPPAPEQPNLHQGARKTAQPSEADMHREYMRTFFPGEQPEPVATP